MRKIVQNLWVSKNIKETLFLAKYIDFGNRVDPIIAQQLSVAKTKVLVWTEI